MKIQFTRYARKALDGIYEWYKERGAGMAGRKIRSAVLKRALTLRNAPYLGQLEFAFEELGLGHRYLVEGHFKIIYLVDETNQVVVISDVFDTRQDPGKMHP